MTEKKEDGKKNTKENGKYTFVGIKIEGTGRKLVVTLLCSLFTLFVLLPFLYKIIFYTDDVEQPKETKEYQEARIREENTLPDKTMEMKEDFALWFSAHILDILIIIILIAILVIVSHKKICVFYLKHKIVSLQNEKNLLGILLQKIEAQYKEGKIVGSKYIVRREIYKEQKNKIEMLLPRLKFKLEKIYMPLIAAKDELMKTEKTTMKEKTAEDAKKENEASEIKKQDIKKQDTKEKQQQPLTQFLK
ncbi:hypothetical protein HZC31_03620 [Candidatus Woesearchaeota archaeon]|nr:hypothetical protein [Candidatus Woesearchaeota archaeon]